MWFGERFFIFIETGSLKKVIIIRHAKSDQRFWGSDFERPLNDRGKEDAPKMAKRLLEKEKQIDAWIASPALRAKSTAAYFVQVYGCDPSDILFISSLYHAPAEVFYDVIRGLPDNLVTVAIFSHNPGITYFVNSLVPGVSLDNMPTCGVFAIEAEAARWKDFEKSRRRYLFFDYPKSTGT